MFWIQQSKSSFLLVLSRITQATFLILSLYVKVFSKNYPIEFFPIRRHFALPVENATSFVCMLISSLFCFHCGMLLWPIKSIIIIVFRVVNAIVVSVVVILYSFLKNYCIHFITKAVLCTSGFVLVFLLSSQQKHR